MFEENGSRLQRRTGGDSPIGRPPVPIQLSQRFGILPGFLIVLDAAVNCLVKRDQ